MDDNAQAWAHQQELEQQEYEEEVMTKKTGLELLREPFPAHQISKLPKPYKKDSPKGRCNECGGYHGLPAVHLDYVGHAALTERLLDADPNWTWEPLAIGPDGLPVLDRDGGMWIKLTVCGVTRLGYGDAQGKHGGDAMKERIGDALRNAAMRFGAALDLWHKGDLRGEKEVSSEDEVSNEEDPLFDQACAAVRQKIAQCHSARDLTDLYNTSAPAVRDALLNAFSARRQAIQSQVPA